MDILVDKKKNLEGNKLQLPEPARRCQSSQPLILDSNCLIDCLIFIDLFTCNRQVLYQTHIRCFMKTDFLEVWAKLLLYLPSTIKHIINHCSEKPWASWFHLKTDLPKFIAVKFSFFSTKLDPLSKCVPPWRILSCAGLISQNQPWSG